MLKVGPIVLTNAEAFALTPLIDEIEAQQVKRMSVAESHPKDVTTTQYVAFQRLTAPIRAHVRTLTEVKS